MKNFLVYLVITLSQIPCSLFITCMLELQTIWAHFHDSNQYTEFSWTCISAVAICCSNHEQSEIKTSENVSVSWFGYLLAKRLRSYPKSVTPEDDSWFCWWGCLSWRFTGTCKFSPMPKPSVRTEFLLVPFLSLVPYTWTREICLLKILTNHVNDNGLKM